MTNPTPSTSCDPVTLEIVKGALRSMQAEMEAVLGRTAMSAFIKEKKDFFVALFDAEGKLVLGSSLPAFGDIMTPIFKRFAPDTMQPGDLYWYNDCYGSDGAVSHSPDQVFAAPVFAEGRLSAFSQSWAHFNDIGGMRPGSLSPDATDIFQEGIIIPPIRLMRGGRWNDEALRIFLRNSRFPDQSKGDVRASVAAVRLGERRMIELFERFGRVRVLDALAQSMDETCRFVRTRLATTFKPGTYRFTELLDTDGHGNGPFRIRLKLDAMADRLVLDARETDDQARGPVNFIMNADVPKMMLGQYLLSDNPGVLTNHGALQALDEVLTRPGSLLKPNFPAPLGQRGITLIRVLTACQGLVNVATGGNGMASSAVYVIYYLRGRDPRTDDTFLLTDGIAVGYGARSFADGIDAVYLVANENYPAEFLDMEYPVRLRRYGIFRDSGGPGRWRGGCGVVRELEVLAKETMLSNRIDGVDNPPWGVNGGRAGRPGRCVLNPDTPQERVLPPLADGTIVRAGDVIRLETGGGGGWGHPFDREAELVRADVLGGFVSPESAREDYGVVLVGEECEIDETATAKLRAKRPPTKAFHRHDYHDVLT
ncbi:MAG: hydantoinase B/oxoprolinase family protein [Alphaproteobacteria bacterium]|nr:hydantoinase B/oxoprolinase family protein [Alphaproteobacteria bacterium]